MAKREIARDVAVELIEEAHQRCERDGTESALVLVGSAQALATLELAGQQRIANLIALGVIGGGPLSPDPPQLSRDYLLEYYPDMSEELGL